MSLSVAGALRDGLGRTFERNGLQLVAVFLGVRVATTVASDTLARANIEFARQLGTVPAEGAAGGFLPGVAETPTPFALGLSLPAAALLAFAVALLAEAVRIVAVRTMVADRVDTVPGEYIRRNIGIATINGFVGGVIVITLTAIGLVFLVIPGLFLALSFFFVRQEIAVRDVNFVEAMNGSWALSKGHRLQLFVLAAALVFAWLVGAIPGAIAGALAPAAGVVVGAAAQAVVAVFGIASVSRAYVQLRESDEDEVADDAVDEDDDEPTYEGALTADDLPPPDAR